MGLRAADFERYSIRPHTHIMDAQMNFKLRTRQDLEQGLTIHTSTDNLSHGSLSERIESADQAVAKAGIWTINEGRELTGKPPRSDGDRLMSPKGAPAQGGNLNDT